MNGEKDPLEEFHIVVVVPFQHNQFYRIALLDRVFCEGIFIFRRNV